MVVAPQQRSKRKNLMEETTASESFLKYRSKGSNSKGSFK